jgi:dihydrofolate reductase
MNNAEYFDEVSKMKLEYIKNEKILKSGLKLGSIVAVDNNNGIGIGNTLPWGKIKKDMQFFRDTTKNATVVMGRNTFISIGQPLVNRTNIVISSTPIECDDIITVSTPEEAILYSITNSDNDILYFIGGEKLYKYILENNLVRFIYLTRINDASESDKFFPVLDEEKWEKFNLFTENDNNVEMTKLLYTLRRST